MSYADVAGANYAKAMKVIDEFANTPVVSKLKSFGDEYWKENH